MITYFTPEDAPEIMALWLKTTQEAHPFISPAFWQTHYHRVETQFLPASETWVYRHHGHIIGFISVLDRQFIGGLFISSLHQHQGIGRQLLTHCQSQFDELSLDVYRENHPAVAFYRKQGFQVISESVQEETGADEYTMYWQRNVAT